MKIEYKVWSELSKLQRDAVESMLYMPPVYRTSIHGALEKAVEAFDEIDRYPVRQCQHDLLQAIVAYVTNYGSFG